MLRLTHICEARIINIFYSFVSCTSHQENEYRKKSLMDILSKVTQNS